MLERLLFGVWSFFCLLILPSIAVFGSDGSELSPRAVLDPLESAVVDFSHSKILDEEFLKKIYPGAGRSPVLVLNLSHAQFHLQLLAHLPRSLEVLELTGVCLTVEAATALATVLPELLSLKVLGLKSTCLNAPSTHGLPGLLLARGLAQSSGLVSLDLSENDLGTSPGWGELLENLKQLYRLVMLDLSKNQVGAIELPALFEALTKLSSLEGLSLAGNPLGSNGMRVWMDLQFSLPSLRSLDLSKAGINPHGAKYFSEILPGFPSLQFLNLNNNPLEKKGLQEVLIRAVGFHSALVEVDAAESHASRVEMSSLLRRLSTRRPPFRGRINF